MTDEDIDKLDLDGVKDMLKSYVRKYHAESRGAAMARQGRAAAQQQVLDIGKLLTKRGIDWRSEIVWTVPPQEPI
jgi:hypothetical protein